MSITKVLLVYNHPLVKAGLDHVSGEQVGVQLLREFQQVQPFRHVVQLLRPDLVLLAVDISAGNSAAVDLLKALEAPDPDFSTAMLAVDTSVLAKPARLAKGDQNDHSENRVLQPVIQHENGLSLLTPRELEVLSLIGKGAENAEIAWLLSISKRTVETHVQRIYAKLGIKGRAQAVRYAVEHGLMDAWK